MKSIKYLIVVLPLLLFVVNANAQNAGQQEIKHLDIVKMKDGSVFQGQISRINDESLDMELLGGAKATFSRSNVKKIEQRCLNCENPEGKMGPVSAETNGFYHHISIGSISSSTILPGGNFTWSSGYQLNPRIGLGAGLGIQSYGDYQNSFDRYPKVIPFFVESKMYLKKSRHSPYLDLKGGYGITPFRKEAKGGYFFYPSIGTKFGKLENSNFTVNFGMLIQKMSYHFDEQNYDYQIIDRNLILRRWTLQVGMMF